MLHEFIVMNREEILTRSRSKLVARTAPTPTPAELDNGLPLFLDQIAAILRTTRGHHGADHGTMTASAALHGGVLLRMGLTVGQVVHDYGSICQSITELADERDMPITAVEFHTFNRCLDDAIAEAVTAYQDQRDRIVSGADALHLGHLAHEIRNLVGTATLAYSVLTRGTLGIGGSTGKLLGRTLRRMRVLVDRTSAEIRLGADQVDVQRVSVAGLIEEVEIMAVIEASERDLPVSIEAGAPDVFVRVDPQIVASAITNVVQNAFKFTRPHGKITVQARPVGDRVLIEVHDGCGGLPPGDAESLFTPFEQRAPDRSGLGIGLAISRKGVRAFGGDIVVRDVPGHGCVFTIDLPRMAALPGTA